ncbi:MAG TPA: ATP-binding protein [Candidatus Paceibacterota bacterium]|nr:ATP-binding protein [Verrucomicrobiota bacterium]HSA10409.1 ATP-binding protein [Candidatus Paceibacterota bacterium]
MADPAPNNQEIRSAFAEYDRQQTISNFKVACIIGMVLMPAGVIIDNAVYPALAPRFLELRLMSVLLIGAFLALLLTPLGHKHYRFLGITLFMVPASFIAWMIYASPEGAASPYYAGLNLVLLVLAFVLHWTFRESLCAAVLVLGLYLAAVFFHAGLVDQGIFINNVYFLVLTGLIVATGSYFHSKSRFGEFAFRYQLDKQNRVLESTIQQLKETEMQLVQSEKLASLGRFSAGIIHEINNPLNFSATGLFTLRKKGQYLAPEHREEYAEVLKDVEEGIVRVKNIVSDLRTFTHPETESRDQVDVPEVVAAALRFLSNEWKDKVRIEQRLAEHQTIWGNKNMLTQTLLTLLENSFDALRAKSFVNEQPTIEIEGRLEPGKSILVVRDNGTGIESVHLGKIFDPFYTTKDVGEGMGLGLAMCHRIVRNCEGRISVRTEPGKFCEFTLEFPTKGQPWAQD